MRHLGERLTAFVDGELGHGDRDHVLIHLAVCTQCRTEADTLRQLKRRLHALVDGNPPAELLARLRAVAEPVDPGPPRSLPGVAGARALPGTARVLSLSGTPGALSLSGPAKRSVGRGHGRRPADNRPAGRVAAQGRRSRTRYAVMGAVSLAVLGLGTASFVAGVDPTRLPQIAPAIERFAVEHALPSGDVPLLDPGPADSSGTGP